MVMIRELGLQDYHDVYFEMKQFTALRTEQTEDELWLLEHRPVYTQGQAGKAEHILNPQSIPVIQSDRGGQVTYHGPGQLVAYTLFNLEKRQLGVRTFVSLLEETLIKLLHHYEIEGQTRCRAPGVYVQDKKIASIGLRVKNGCTYHGIALNVNMDLSPFEGINPCGYASMQMTQLRDFVDDITVLEVGKHLTTTLLTTLDT